MKIKFYQQFVSLFIIVQLALAPFAVVYAENTTNLQAFGGFSSLVGCKNSTARGMGGQLSSISGLFTKEANSDGKINKNGTGISKIIEEASSKSDAVPVENKDIAKTADNTSTTNDYLKKSETREECLNGLAYRVAKFALAKLTEQTVNWINSGFNGDPFFIRNPESYFKSIVDSEVNSILGPISKYNNGGAYPYGRDYARAFLQNRVSDYNSRAQSNLNNYLSRNMTTSQYARNFGAGGWDGWLGLTQNPANNPLGFGMITSQEISDRTARKTQDTLNELNWGDGFLSQKRCVEPKDYTPGNAQKNPCKKWETVTPGIAISGQLSKVMGTSYNQLEMADQINESMSLIFDALINQAMTKGISNLSTKKNGEYTTFGGVGSNRVYSSTGQDITNLNSNGQNQYGNPIGGPSSSGWFNQEEEFDITGVRSNNNLSWILGRQRKYKQELGETIKVIPNILPNIGELDYCIPGPNPNWTTDVEYTLGNIESLQAKGINLSDPAFKEVSSAWGVAGNALMLVGGGLIASGVGAPIGIAVSAVGLMVNMVSSWIGEKRQDEYNANKTIVENIQEAEINMRSRLLTETAGIDRLEYEKYKQAIETYYSKNIPVAEKALGMTSNINSYKKAVPEAIDAYNQSINETTVSINELMDIKRQVDEIMSKPKYQNELNKCGTSSAPVDLGSFNGVGTDVGGGVRPGGGSSGPTSGGFNGSGGFIQFPQ